MADVLRQIEVEAVQAEVCADDLRGLDEAVADVDRVAGHLAPVKKKRAA